MKQNLQGHNNLHEKRNNNKNKKLTVILICRIKKASHNIAKVMTIKGIQSII